MNPKSTVFLFLCAGAILHSDGFVRAAEPEPAQTPAAPAVLQADYNAAIGGINRSVNRKPKAAYEAFLKYLDETAGLAENMRMDLHHRILANAFVADAEGYAKHLLRFMAEPESPRKSNTLSALIRDFAKTSPAQLAEAEKLYAQYSARLTPQQRIAASADLACNGLRFAYDIDAFRAAFEQVRQTAAPEADENAALTWEKNIGDKLVNMLAALMPFDMDEAQTLMSANIARFDPGQRMVLAKARIQAALANKDRRAFDAALADFEKLPDPTARLAHYPEIARGIAGDDHDMAERILRHALQHPEYSTGQRQELLAQLCALNRPKAFEYGFYTPGAYEKYKALAGETLDMIGQALADGSTRQDRRLANLYYDFATTAADFGDYPFAETMLANARRNHPVDFAFVPLALRLALRSNTLEAVRGVVDPLLANEKENAANRTFLKAVLFIYQHKDFKLFDAEVYGDQTFTSADRMILIRRASEIFFRGGRYELCRLAHAEVFDNMFTPPAFKEYTVKSLPGAPRTADAWARSPFYNQWDQMETRFVPYGDGYDMGNTTDGKRHLKDAEPVSLPDEYRTGVHLAYDDTGLHIYIRCDDPAVAEVVRGERKGDGLELLFRPGEDAAYHSWYFGNPPTDNDEPHLVNWAAPTPRYRLTYDNFTKDATATAEAIVAHTFIPWIAFYDNLPINGNVWKFGMQRWGRHAATLNGSVHELARALTLKFAFTPAGLTTIKRNVAITAFNRYNTLRRNDGEFIQTWNDKVLGDPDFYKAELEALIADLDDAGKRLTAPAPDADIDALYARYVPLWAEIHYVIAERRNAYLKRQLLK